MNGEYLNVGLTIANEIHALHLQRQGSLSYASIITQMCIESGVSCEGLVPMRPGATLDVKSIKGEASSRARPEAPSTSKAKATSKSKGKAPMAETSSHATDSKQDKILRHLRVVQGNIRRVHESTRACIALEPLLRSVAAQMNLPVEKLVPLEAFDSEMMEDLMRFEEFSEDCEGQALNETQDDNDEEVEGERNEEVESDEEEEEDTQEED